MVLVAVLVLVVSPVMDVYESDSGVEAALEAASFVNGCHVGSLDGLQAGERACTDIFKVLSIDIKYLVSYL